VAAQISAFVGAPTPSGDAFIYHNTVVVAPPITLVYTTTIYAWSKDEVYPRAELHEAQKPLFPAMPELFDALVGASSNRDLLSIEPDYFMQGLIPIAPRRTCA
jgi:hypothetical protein